MLGFAVMMCFVSIVLILTACALLNGNHSGVHGKIYNQTNDKEGYAKALGKTVMFLGICLAISGIIAFKTNTIYLSLICIVCAIVITGAWFSAIQKRFKQI